jgi:hypothetical protein
VGEFIAKHHPVSETDQNHETATLVRHFRNAYIALTGKKMSDLIARLQDMVDFKHDDMDVAREAIVEITRLRAELTTARREGMEEAVAILRARHRGLEHIREWREAQHCADEIEAEIRAAAKEGNQS